MWWADTRKACRRWRFLAPHLLKAFMMEAYFAPVTTEVQWKEFVFIPVWFEGTDVSSNCRASRGSPEGFVLYSMCVFVYVHPFPCLTGVKCLHKPTWEYYKYRDWGSMWPLGPGKHVKGFMYSRVRTEKLWTLIPQVKHDVLGEAACCLLLPLSLLRLTLAGRSLR